MLIYIVGYMCSGKTTLGKELAEKLNYRFIDLDEQIVSSTGLSIFDFFSKYGEEEFRLKERELLLHHLEDQDTVIATGGGAPCYSDNIDLMNRHGMTVFLDTPVDVILNRISVKPEDRPMLKNIPADQLPGYVRTHLGSRRGFYEKAKIRVEEADVDAVMQMIMSPTSKPVGYSFQ
jgi:shikimate kinase